MMSHDLHLLTVGGEAWKANMEEAGRGSGGPFRGKQPHTGPRQ